MPWVENASPEVDEISQWRLIFGVCLSLSVLMVAVVSTRLWIRYKARGLAADDIMAALSMLFAVIYSVLCIVQTKFGLGLPVKLRPEADLIPYTRVNFAGRPFYQLGISFFKIALLLSYLRLFEGTHERVYRRAVWISVWAIFLGHLGCTLSLIFACSPVSKSWNPLEAGTCIPNGPSFTGYAVVTIISDVAVSIIPIPMLLKLNIPLAKKLGLGAIFLLGLFTTVCSIERYLQITQITLDGNSTMLVLWGTIEFNVGNMVSSLPFLAPVFLRKAKAYRTGRSGSSGNAASSGRVGDRYKLSSLSRDRGGFRSTMPESGSEENILKEQGIVKSVTVQVDEEWGAKEAPPARRPF